MAVSGDGVGTIGLMPKRVWFAGIGLLGIADLWAAYVRHEGTLSHAIRETFGTDTTAGKARFALAWTALTAWLLPHIWSWPEDRR